MKQSNGDKIRQIRLSMNLTQVELANLMGLARRTIQRWESGEHPCKSAFVQLVEALAAKMRQPN
jgi:transcriptional regulator with XRE-family HTH domain